MNGGRHAAPVIASFDRTVDGHANASPVLQAHGRGNESRIVIKRPDDPGMGPGAFQYSVHEFIVELLGSLIPGAIFLSAAVVILAPAGRVASDALRTGALASAQPPLTSSALLSVKDLPASAFFGAFSLFVIAAYVVGTLFSRRGPSEPDQASFDFLSQRDYPAGHTARTREDWCERHLASQPDKECQFPYSHLRTYLEHRGHHHLADLVDWPVDDDATIDDSPGVSKSKRSKTYINLLKIRLQFHFPAAYRRLLRNEANVRLSTSMWFVARALNWCAITAAIAVIITILATGVIAGHDAVWPSLLGYAPSLLPAATLVFAAHYARRSIRQFIHYQRLREVFFVLEEAYTAFRDQPELLRSLRVFSSFRRA